jgi:PII-like signaling protein
VQGQAMRLTVLVGEDLWHHKPVAHEIVRRAREAGLAGATVFRAVEGYGARSRIHTLRLLSLADGLANLVMIVDTEERVREFVPRLDGLFTDGLVLLEPVEVVVPAPPRRRV